ncbi:MAG UNVERIFIED_CONTAM: hypothetical protein LVQ98_04905 [Rickettsiaceae bacterium]|jgi:hypothetical protein
MNLLNTIVYDTDFLVPDVVKKTVIDAAIQIALDPKLTPRAILERIAVIANREIFRDSLRYISIR